VLFGSYARGEYGLKSDVDLAVLFEGTASPEGTLAASSVIRAIGEIEGAHRLPMHISPLLGSVDRPADLGPDLLHALWSDGIVLYARAGSLARLHPEDLAPATIVRYTLGAAPPEERMRLSRRLHGVRRKGGALGPGALVLGRGALLVPGEQVPAVRQALDEVGATYDLIPVWRGA
jgi:hypothetical protein